MSDDGSAWSQAAEKDMKRIKLYLHGWYRPLHACAQSTSMRYLKSYETNPTYNHIIRRVLKLCREELSTKLGNELVLYRESRFRVARPESIATCLALSVLVCSRRNLEMACVRQPIAAQWTEVGQLEVPMSFKKLCFGEKGDVPTQ